MAAVNEEVLEWITLRRVLGGNVARIGSAYFDSGNRLPSFLAPVLNRLIGSGLMETTRQNDLIRITLTDSGEARYRELAMHPRQ